MVHIVLRDDGWFKAGKDCEGDGSVIFLTYKAKQELLGDLEAIGEQPSVEALKGELRKLSSDYFNFKRCPYLQANDVYIDTHGMPGSCYLGRIEE